MSQLDAVYLQTAMDSKFDLSLFERLYNHFKPLEPSPIVLLDTQYRMNPDIAHFPSHYVYNSKLVNHRSVLYKHVVLCSMLYYYTSNYYYFIIPRL